MPVIQSYKFYSITSEWEELCPFLVNSIPRNHNTIKLIWKDFWFFEWNNNFLYVREVASKTIEIVSLMKFKFTWSEFWSLVKAARKVKSLRFEICIIKTDSKCDFGDMKQCWIEELFFWDWGSYAYSNWNEKKERLINIFEAIDKWANLKNSVKKIDLKWSNHKKLVNLDKLEFTKRFPNLIDINILT